MTGPTDQDNGTGLPPDSAAGDGPVPGAGPGGAAAPAGGPSHGGPPPGGPQPGGPQPVPPEGTADVGETAPEGTVTEAAEVLDPLAVVTAERDEYPDALRRLQAEFDNYRKRVARQQAEAGDRAAAVLVEKLLPVLDTLDLAAAHLGEEPGPDGTALLQASAQLNDVLAKEGLERIDPTGMPFDPTAHEAVGHEPAPEPAPVPGAGENEGDGEGEGDGTTGPGEADGDTTGDGPGGDGGAVVARVMRAGFRWRGAVVRPAMVTVRG